MSVPALYSVQIFVGGKKVATLSNVRNNGGFRALKRWLIPRFPRATINLYYQGVFQRQIKWDSEAQYF
jgi:hypothetical protein